MNRGMRLAARLATGFGGFSMKTFAIACTGLALLAGFGGQAVAADMARPMVTKAAPVPAGPSWTGFFVGGQGGYSWGSQDFTLTGVAPGLVSTDPSGGFGGVIYGTNYQFGQWVLGTISDFSFADISSSGAVPGGVIQQEINYFDTTRLRAGFLVTDSMLVYASGGLAWGNVKGSFTGAPGFPSGTFRDGRFGWTAGGGIEVAYGQWSILAEYLHYDLGDETYGLAGGAVVANSDVSGDLVRGALIYRFNWTPWQLITGQARF